MVLSLYTHFLFMLFFTWSRCLLCVPLLGFARGAAFPSRFRKIFDSGSKNPERGSQKGCEGVRSPRGSRIRCQKTWQRCHKPRGGAPKRLFRNQIPSWFSDPVPKKLAAKSQNAETTRPKGCQGARSPRGFRIRRQKIQRRSGKPRAGRPKRVSKSQIRSRFPKPRADLVTQERRSVRKRAVKKRDPLALSDRSRHFFVDSHGPGGPHFGSPKCISLRGNRKKQLPKTHQKSCKKKKTIERLNILLKSKISIFGPQRGPIFFEFCEGFCVFGRLLGTQKHRGCPQKHDTMCRKTRGDPVSSKPFCERFCVFGCPNSRAVLGTASGSGFVEPFLGILLGVLAFPPRFLVPRTKTSRGSDAGNPWCRASSGFLGLKPKIFRPGDGNAIENPFFQSLFGTPPRGFCVRDQRIWHLIRKRRGDLTPEHPFWDAPLGIFGAVVNLNSWETVTPRGSAPLTP